MPRWKLLSTSFLKSKRTTGCRLPYLKNVLQTANSEVPVTRSVITNLANRRAPDVKDSGPAL